MQPIVTLSPAGMRRCYEWGEEFVKRRAKEGARSRSQALARDDIDKDPIAQAYAKMDECAAAMCFGVDPRTINWDFVPDRGWDFIYHSRYSKLSIDAKGSKWNSTCLLWPIGKNEIFHNVHCDLLVFVQHDPPRFRLNGYIGKGYFGKHHHVAGRHHKLQEGTWYMDEEELWDLAMLLPSEPPSQWRSIISCWGADAPTASAANTATGASSSTATPSTAKPS